MAAYIDSVAKAFPDPAADGSPNVVLIGHSMGGAVISHVAAQYPERISQLVYVSAMFPRIDLSINEMLDEIRVKGDVALNAICKEFTPYPAAARKLVRQPKKPREKDFIPSAGYADIAKTYIGCTGDKIIPPTAQDHMLQGQTLQSRRTLPTGHLPQFENKSALVDMLDKVLSL